MAATPGGGPETAFLRVWPLSCVSDSTTASWPRGLIVTTGCQFLQILVYEGSPLNLECENSILRLPFVRPGIRVTACFPRRQRKPCLNKPP